MDRIDIQGRLIHSVPMPVALRFLLGAAGLIAMLIVVVELWRGVWPPNVTSPFFLVVIVGGFAVGVTIFLAALIAPSTSWSVGPGRITLTRRNPFRNRTLEFTPSDVDLFEDREIVWDGSANTFAVVLVTRTGERYQSRDYATSSSARALRHEIETLFYGAPPAGEGAANA